MKARRRRPIPYICLGILFILIAVFIAVSKFEKHVFPISYRPLVFHAANEVELDPFFVAALIYHESHFNPDALSVTGAAGLMQLQVSTLEELLRKHLIPQGSFEEKDIWDPEVNVMLGTLYLRVLFSRMYATPERQEKLQQWTEGNPDLFVLHCYNAGPTFVLAQFDSSTTFREYMYKMATLRAVTVRYAHNVLNTYDWLRLLARLRLVDA